VAQGWAHRCGLEEPPCCGAQQHEKQARCVFAEMLVYGYRLDVAHVQGTQTVESYHWKLKGPHRGWELWSTRRLDYEFITLTKPVSDYFQHQLTLQCHGELQSLTSSSMPHNVLLAPPFLPAAAPPPCRCGTVLSRDLLLYSIHANRKKEKDKRACTLGVCSGHCKKEK
jgi:hypothetical protein